MKKKKITLLIYGIMLCFSGVKGQENLKVMFYNVLNYPLEDAVPNRIDDLGVILNDYEPDLFMICELNNESGAMDILNSLKTNVSANFEMANFELNTSDDTGSDQNDLQNLIYYNSEKFSLQSQDIVTTIFRDFNVYNLRLNSTDQNTNPIDFTAIVCHLKASNGLANEALREQMVEDLEDYLDLLPAETKVLLAGDFNMYTSSEDGFQALTDFNNNIWFMDPADRVGSWSNNTNYLDVFTQSTRTQTGLGGATGGFDDRFDFIMTTENLMIDPELSYVANSYKVFGNNNNPNCYNSRINSSDCSGSDFSFAIREALHNFSDHLPVTIELQTNASLTNQEFLAEANIEFVDGNLISDQLRLKINPSIVITSPIEIYDALGHLVKTITLSNSIIQTVTVSELSNGLYFLRFPEVNIETLKFIKN
ncbi:T9SS type A sorting domain-containing protein [Ichthyenterobacterium sp. W332]|uniref:T9SS type A sorting domain-containing protein n=1 Tax=Microcosmobacter mediterraneus TaxID=3075607 RepID=A0ABU2YH73_9FLAO|nr:endonuclease/exonuclease/phosphatase family protein [Ichthyenterobacterium sp. W332]MDT0557476.1 T9SS type A sorting domain-containing protein [Ichthyenterobacterium sp. W332]